MKQLITRLSFAFAASALTASAATVAIAIPTATAATRTNPQTGCIGANNMMPAPGMSTQGWATLPDDNPGLDPSGSGMFKAMFVSDPSFPTMCITG